MTILGYVMLGFYGLSRLLDLFLVNRFEYGVEGTPVYSIFASQKLFIGYQIWAIIMSAFAAYSIWKKQRFLIYVSMFILIILFFYPYFTAK